MYRTIDFVVKEESLSPKLLGRLVQEFVKYLAFSRQHVDCQVHELLARAERCTDVFPRRSHPTAAARATATLPSLSSSPLNLLSDQASPSCTYASLSASSSTNNVSSVRPTALPCLNAKEKKNMKKLVASASAIQMLLFDVELAFSSTPVPRGVLIAFSPSGRKAEEVYYLDFSYVNTVFATNADENDTDHNGNGREGNGKHDDAVCRLFLRRFVTSCPELFVPRPRPFRGTMKAFMCVDTQDSTGAIYSGFNALETSVPSLSLLQQHQSLSSSSSSSFLSSSSSSVQSVSVAGDTVSFHSLPFVVRIVPSHKQQEANSLVGTDGDAGDAEDEGVYSSPAPPELASVMSLQSTSSAFLRRPPSSGSSQQMMTLSAHGARVRPSAIAKKGFIVYKAPAADRRRDEKCMRDGGDDFGDEGEDFESSDGDDASDDACGGRGTHRSGLQLLTNARRAKESTGSIENTDSALRRIDGAGPPVFDGANVAKSDLGSVSGGFLSLLPAPSMREQDRDKSCALDPAPCGGSISALPSARAIQLLGPLPTLAAEEEGPLVDTGPRNARGWEPVASAAASTPGVAWLLHVSPVPGLGRV